MIVQPKKYRLRKMEPDMRGADRIKEPTLVLSLLYS